MQGHMVGRKTEGRHWWQVSMGRTEQARQGNLKNVTMVWATGAVPNCLAWGDQGSSQGLKV
jgi:hypothetical protein